MKEHERISQQLQEAMARENWTQMSLSKRTGVHQSQVSRIVRGQFIRVSKNVVELCKYAKIPISSHSTPLPISHEVEQAIAELIDGRKETEAALLSLLRASARLIQTQVRGQSHRT